ncbi:hypothetical protein [Actinomadura rubrisoli]|uniref:Uncharacterized protein n=1 Tax=Actinomadura rubrisoli TaxID=2530368 RepID=A0A4R5CHE1_9ACTN|nr:hypothetical protein [Actinomadura rubrisoli]TDD97723.1 hypothetical protein E1298_01415 [Actinomadura rubrisoli]
MSLVTEMSVLMAERAAGRAADAAQDVVALLAQGRSGEALDAIEEVRRHLNATQTQLERSLD